jgi:tRNA (Thr-GGU) A37 N-methylase
MSNTEGLIEIFPEFEKELNDFNGFSHSIYLYYSDVVKFPVPLQSKAFLSEEKKEFLRDFYYY